MRHPWTAAARTGLIAAVALLTASCAASAGTRDHAHPAPATADTSDHSAAPAHHHTPGMHMPGHTQGMKMPRTPATGSRGQPSEAAAMVCTHITAAAVHRLASPAHTPPRTHTWDGTTFTCTYTVPAGKIVLSVFDATDPATGRRHFDTLLTHTTGAEPITGMAAFNFPAFETGHGIVAFLKDGKTLRVDTTRLHANTIGPGHYTRGQLAYALAAAVIACWTG